MTQSRFSVGYATVADAQDRRSWSGILYQMAQGLEGQGADIRYLGPMDNGPLWREKIIKRAADALKRPALRPAQTPGAARSFARQVMAKIDHDRPDLIYAPVGSAVIAELPPGLPVAYSSDATARLMRDYYPDRQALDARSLDRLEAIEAAAIARADLMIYPTQWAAQSAISDYGADPSQVHVVPMGANTDAPPREDALAPREEGPLRLLFVGVSWPRKGGDIAVAALDALHARGIDAHLTVIGCKPPAEALRDSMTVIPFLNKNLPEDRARFLSAYLGSDLFLLPTRRECFGIVFCEAAAHGLPSITTDTGGVSDVVREGVTGYTLPEEADGAAYADVMERILNAPDGLAALRKSARDDFETRLNWTAWARKTSALMRELVAA